MCDFRVAKVPIIHVCLGLTKSPSWALCRGNGSILAAGQKVLAQVTRHDVQPGLPRPRAELI